MARWQGLVALVINHKRYPAGQTYADTKANAIGNDVVYAPFGVSAKVNPGMVPLDGAAQTLRDASIWASTPLPCTITGVNSIDG